MTDQHPVVYLLNSAAWALVGSILTLTYQRVSAWWRHSHGKRPGSQVTFNNFVATMTVLIAVVGVLFTQSYRVQMEDYERCQARVNLQFREANLARAGIADDDRRTVDALVDRIVRAGLNRAVVQAALSDYQTQRADNDQARAAHPIVVDGGCKKPEVASGA